jgi:hypothetical protein
VVGALGRNLGLFLAFGFRNQYGLRQKWMNEEYRKSKLPWTFVMAIESERFRLSIEANGYGTGSNHSRNYQCERGSEAPSHIATQ